MKPLFVCSLLLSLFVASFSFASAQRPRRVGDGSSTQPASPPASTTPSRPPVLGGANNPNNQQPKPNRAPEPTGPEEVSAGDVIKVNTTLVTIPVSVMDRDGRYVPNLNKQDFRIWEDGVEQEVAVFSSVDKPFSVVLMLDTSPSTQFRLEDIQDAAISFINQLRPDDMVMVVSFNNSIKVQTDFTNDRYRLQRAIRNTHTDDGTRLYDAVDQVINQRLSRVTGRKAIVLFTDGVDTTSKHSDYQSNVTDAQELDALIYPVQYDTSGDIAQMPPVYGGRPVDVWGQVLGGIFGGGGGRGGRGGGGGWPGGGGRGGGWPGGRGGGAGDYELADHYLHELAEDTGGRLYQADSVRNMSLAFANVAEELRRQYTIGYYPKRPPQAGQRRQIRVRANQPNLAVRSRDSYIFNPSGTPVDQTSSQKNAPVLRH
jgi:VWFA-related protein